MYRRTLKAISGYMSNISESIIPCLDALERFVLKNYQHSLPTMVYRVRDFQNYSEVPEYGLQDATFVSLAFIHLVEIWDGVGD